MFECNQCECVQSKRKRFITVNFRCGQVIRSFMFCDESCLSDFLMFSRSMDANVWDKREWRVGA